MQIVQFVVDLHLVYFGSESNVFDVAIHLMAIASPAYSYFAAAYWPELPALGSCHGTESAAVFGCALLSSYLLLFIKFYIDTYKKPARGKKPVTNGHANGNALVHFDVDFDSRLMALLIAGSRKIKDAHREKVHTNGRTGRRQGYLFLSLLDIPP